MKYILLSTLFLSLASCTTGTKSVSEKITLEKSTGKNDLPDWTEKPQNSWSMDDTYFFKSSYSVRGDQRVNACYDLAKAEARENILTEFKSFFSSEINGYTQGLNETDAQELNKMFVTSVKSHLYGLKLSESVHERYIIQNSEKIQCHVLLTMNKESLLKNIQTALSNGTKINGEVAKQMKDRAVKFFDSNIDE